MTRRDLLKLPLAAAAAPMLAAPRIGEYDADNTKIASMVSVKASDNQLLFFKQIGLRWVHAEFGDDAPFDVIKNFQDRLARYGIKIHCGILDTYRSTKIQLGQPGRDQDIEKYQTFLRDLGKLGIYSSKIDFHPGNTYTTSMIESPRGYKVRQFDLDDFHKKVEKQRYERVYTADDMWANYTYF